jgi:hypothetical protein
VAFPVFGNEEALAVVAGHDGHPALEQTHHRIFFRLDLLIPLDQHFNPCDD